MSRLIDADAFWKPFEEGKAKLLLIKSMLPPEMIDATLKIYAEIKEMIDSMPTIKPEPQWIPCSERLPQKSGNYIVTERRYSVDDRKHEGKYQTIVERVGFTGEKWERAKFFDIIAWLPLPSPYQPEEE